MKKLLFILLLASSHVGYSQNAFNTDEFVSTFGNSVNKNLHLYDKTDLEIINQSNISKKQPLEKQLAEWVSIPVSENFIDGSPEKKALMEQLHQICIPLWKSSVDTEKEAHDLFQEIDSKFATLENGKVVQYFFTHLVSLELIQMMILGEPAY